MTPTPKPEDEFRMPADEFDRIMRGALSSPAPDPEPKKPAREPKKVMKTKPTLKRGEG
jgi:hypothetical protein